MKFLENFYLIDFKKVKSQKICFQKSSMYTPSLKNNIRKKGENIRAK